MIFENSGSAQIDFTKEVPYLSFPVLSEIPFIKHGFSTRLGGVSSGIFSSMNLGNNAAPVIDESNNIEENYKRISTSIGVDFSSLTLTDQVHQTNIRLITKEDCGKGISRPRDYEKIDGFITNVPNITLVTKYADCVPLFFVDPKNKTIGLTHSGWRGTVMKIGKITIEAMTDKFGSDPEDIIAVIGPSICASCFEIGEEVADEFKKAFPNNWQNDILVAKEQKKFQCDLWAANRIVLSEAGLKQEHIHCSNVCTACNPDLFFSHRKTMGNRGSLAAFLALT
ncbi:MAG: peptidoglycan editing factor PgeF [Mobilitalea sp.]